MLTFEEEVELGRRVRAGRHAVAVASPENGSDGGGSIARPLSRGRLDHDGTEARNALVSANLRLVIWAVQRWRPRLVDHDELVAAGYHGLIRAADLWNPDRGVKFCTYATYAICSDLRLATEEARRRARFVNLTEDSNVFATLTAPREQPDERLDSAADRQALRAALESLPERERAVIRRRFGLGTPRETLQSIAADLGVTKERVRQVENRARGRLRAMLSRTEQEF